MKKMHYAALSFALALAIAPAAFAKDANTVNPGMTPDSPWYFLDGWGEKLGLLLAFGPEAKAEKALQYAEEKVAEAQAMGNDTKGDEADEASENEEQYINEAQEQATAAENNGQDITTLTKKLEDITDRHLDVLHRVYDQVPDQAKDSIAKVIEKVQAHHERMLEKFIEHFQNGKLTREEVEQQIEDEVSQADEQLNDRLARLQAKLDEKSAKLDEKEAESEQRLFDRKAKWEEKLAELQDVNPDLVQKRQQQFEEARTRMEQHYNDLRTRLQERINEQMQQAQDQAESTNTNQNTNTAEN